LGFWEVPTPGLPGLAAIEIGNQEAEVSWKSNRIVENLKQSNNINLYHLVYDEMEMDY
jgi:hypothetical protein